MNEVSKQKFLFDAIKCSSIIRSDVPDKLEFLKLAKENMVAFAFDFEAQEEYDKSTINDDVVQAIKKMIKGSTVVFIRRAGFGIIGMVTNLSPKITDYMMLKKSSLELANQIKAIIQKEFRLIINIGVSRIFNGHNGLGFAYDEATIALEDSFFKEPGAITHVDDMCGLALTETSNELIAFIEATDFRAASESLKRFYDYLRDNIRNVLCLYIRLLANLLVEIYQYLLETAKVINQDEMMNMPEVYKKMEACTTINEAYQVAEAFIKDTIDYLKRLRYKKHEVLVNRAISYIELNNSQNIGLSDVAAYIGISTGHFSNIFKQYTKKNFVQYLVEYRIEQAKKLLLLPEMTVNEVASLTGFNDDKYFYRIFKAHTGLTPTNYRNE